MPLPSWLDYELPEDLVAQHPLRERDAARLLLLRRRGGSLEHRHVRDLPSLLPPRTLLVVNDTRVLPARLYGRRPTGGRVELLLVERHGPEGPRERWTAMGRANRPLRPGDEIDLEGGWSARVEAVLPDGTRCIEIDTMGHDESVSRGLHRVGHVPLPPYVRRSEAPEDRERYQTIFARRPGAVAAPTAGLHFTEALLQALRVAGHELCSVTLHVGPGTFRPIEGEDLEAHRMHRERYEVPETTAHRIAQAKREGRTVLAVGTTVVRTLEAAALPDGTVRSGSGSTELFIRPGYAFRTVDALMTNFHLPRSTLLALVMAFAGIEPVRRAYQEAIRLRYRFYSYGDAMLIL